MPPPERRLSPDPRWLEMPLVREWGYTVRNHASTLKRHRNNGFEITFTPSGAFVWEVIGQGRLELTGGHVCLTQPRVLHHGEDDLFAPGELYFLVLAPAARGARRHTPFTAAELRSFGHRLEQCGNAVVKARRELGECFAALRRVFEALARGAPDPLLRPWARTVVAQVLMATAQSFHEPQADEQSALVRAARDFMEQHCTESLGMDVVAAHVGLRRTRFYEIFRREVGLTPLDYLQRLRCRRACLALRESGETITRIAHRSGFSSSQYFALCFRKYLQCSPSEYRARYGEAPRGP